MSVSPSSFSQSTHRDVDNPRLRVPPVGTEHGTNCSLHLSPGVSPPFQIAPFSTRRSLQNSQKMAVPTQTALVFRRSSGIGGRGCWLKSALPPSAYLGFIAMWMFSGSDSSNFCLSLVPWPTAQFQYFFFQQHQHPQPFPLSFFGLL